MVNVWTIYSKNGVAKASVKELELHDEWMAECFLTLTVKSAEPIDFAVGDYIDYRGERYSINYDPSFVKKARRGSYGEGFTYDNIKFVSDQDEIARCDFNDIVLNDNNIHYTALPTFPFYCETVDDLLDRVQANLEELYPGGWIIISPDRVRDAQRGRCVGRENAFVAAYEQYIGSGSEFTYEKTDVPLTADNNTCWEALGWCNTSFGLNFIVRGRVVIVGTAGIITSSKFKYGRGNGLYEIERIGDSEQKIVTRLKAYGNETNLPMRYYANMHTRIYGTNTVEGDGIANLDVAFRTDYFKNEFSSGETDVTVEIGGVTYAAKAYANNETLNIIINVMTSVTIPLNARVYMVSGVQEASWPDDHREYAGGSGLPDNMAVTHLMLPGFPDVSLAAWVAENRPELLTEGFEFSTDSTRPYIDSPNKSLYGIRPSSIFFDGSDETEDIYPTIKGMGVDTITAAEQIEDNGVFMEGTVPNFKITLPNLGFDLAKYYQQGAKIEMTDGMCGGRGFEIAATPKQNDYNQWECECKRSEDTALNLWFPYNDFNIHTGDHYVLTGIDMPDEYIAAASVRLFDAAIDALRKNHAPRYTFQPRIDEIWMQRQDDIAKASGGVIESLHDTLKAGDIFAFADADLGIDAKIIIDVLTIKENGNNGLPTYEVTLRDEKVVSTLQRTLNKISNSGSGGLGGGSGYNTRQTESLIEEEGSELFLSKIHDDEAQGLIGFLKGAWFGTKNFIIDALGNANFNDTIVNGQLTSNNMRSTNYTGDGMFDTGGLFQYLNGKAKLVCDNIVCRGKFVVNEIEDRIWTYAGGNLIFSSAGSTIFYVEYLDANNEPLGYTYINSPWLLKKIPLLARVIAWSKKRQVQKQLTPEEQARVVKFRCYETSDDGTMQTRNWWHVNDLALCQSLNHVKDKTTTSGGYSGSLSNKVYCRRVAAIGSKKIPLINDNRIYDYVELWNVLNVTGKTYIDDDGTTKTIVDSVPGYDNSYVPDWPAAGDVLVQRGNAVNTDRQGFSTVEVTGTQRGFKVYDNVNSYSMEDKKKAFLGYDADKKRGMLEVFGDAYIGAYGSGADPHDGATYVKFDSRRGELTIKAKIDASSTVDGKALENYINGLISDVTDAIQTQVDQKAETWYQANDPSTAWTTAEERNKHIGDLWHRTTDNKSFYYQASGWVEEYVPNEVFDTIDGKAAIYVTWNAWMDGTTNNLQVKDLFIPAADTTQGGVTYKANKAYRCTNASTPTFQELSYTDDGAFLNWKANGYAQDLTNTNNSITNVDTKAGNAATAAANAATAASNAQTAADNAATDAATAQRTANTAKQKADALDAVKGALNGGTLVDGGLLLTSLIGLRHNTGTASNPSYTTWGGINGVYTDGATIAAWFGGGMGDIVRYPGLTDYATSVIRMNGSGYFASGKIRWDASGNAKFEGEIDATSGKIGNFEVGTVYLGTERTSDNTYNRVELYYDGGIYAYSNSTTRKALKTLGMVEMVGYENGSETAPIFKISGNDITLGFRDTTDTDSKVFLPAIIYGGTSSTANYKIDVREMRYTYNGNASTPYWHKFGRRDFRLAGTSSTNPTAETLHDVDEIFMLQGNVKMPSGQYNGQHITVISSASNQKIYGHLNGSANNNFNIGNANEVWDLYWTGSTWAVGFMNKAS